MANYTFIGSTDVDEQFLYFLNKKTDRVETLKAYCTNYLNVLKQCDIIDNETYRGIILPFVPNSSVDKVIKICIDVLNEYKDRNKYLQKKICGEVDTIDVYLKGLLYRELYARLQEYDCDLMNSVLKEVCDKYYILCIKVSTGELTFDLDKDEKDLYCIGKMVWVRNEIDKYVNIDLEDREAFFFNDAYHVFKVWHVISSIKYYAENLGDRWKRFTILTQESCQPRLLCENDESAVIMPLKYVMEYKSWESITGLEPLGTVGVEIEWYEDGIVQINDTYDYKLAVSAYDITGMVI